MLRFALFGAGRIGRMHAKNLAADPRIALSYVYDVVEEAARETAEKHGARIAPDVELVLSGDEVDAVLIASPTNTHVDLITMAARAGKAVLCEKPIDLDIARVNRCRDEIGDCKVPVQIGFNRRFDPAHSALRAAVAAGELGQLQQLVISSRDPGLAPFDYLRVSGGLFRDMMIHDFDLARFILGEDPVEIGATGSIQIEPRLADLDDIDSAMVIMKTASGKLCHINCSRRAVYGYDQRVEAFGEAGMLISGNRTSTALERYDEKFTAAREPLLDFFIERYADSYLNQTTAFIDSIENGRTPSPSFEDGRRALMLADAAGESLRTGRTVRLRFE